MWNGATPGDTTELRQLPLIGLVYYSSSLENLESGDGVTLDLDPG